MITQERYEELESYWNDETNDEDTQEWRYELTQEEEELVDEWDYNFNAGMCSVLKKILELSGEKND